MRMPTDVVTNDVMETIVERWGIDSQLDLAIEECAELIVEFAKLRGHPSIAMRADSIKSIMKRIRAANHIHGTKVERQQPVDVRDHLGEEIADTHLILEQLLRVFALLPEFDEYHEKKLERLKNDYTDDPVNTSRSRR